MFVQGHELTLRVLYRLHGDAEVESDFFSSTTATSVYETFLLTVVRILSSFVLLFLFIKAELLKSFFQCRLKPFEIHYHLRINL